METSTNRSLRFCKSIFLSLYQKSQYLTVASCLSYTIWIVGLVVLIGLAIRDFIPLMEEYQEKNKATQAEVVIVDDAFKPPQIMVQFPAYKVENRESEALWELATRVRDGTVTDPNCTMCRRLEEVGWDVWRNFSTEKYTNNDVHAVYGALSVAFVGHYYKSLKTSEDALDKKFSHWNEPIVSSLLELLIWRDVFFYNSISEYDYNSDFFATGISLSRALDNYQDTEKMDLLFSQILKALCRMIVLTESNSWNEVDGYERTNQTCTEFLLNSSAPASLDVDGLWAAVPVIAEMKSTVFDWTFLSYVNSTNSLWIPTNGTRPRKFWIYPETSVLYVGSAGSLYSPSIYEVPVDDDKYGHIVTVRYSIQMRAKETRRGQNCHNETTAAACVNKCTSLWLIKICGCVPFITRVGLDYDRSLRYCDPVTYIKCFPKKESATVRQEKCREQCKSACEYTAYNWRINHEFIIPDNPNTVQFTLRMLPVFNTFAQFNWIEKDTPEQFLSQVGGLVGGYLGLSAVSLLTFIITCIEVIKRFCLGKNEVESQKVDAVIQMSGKNSPEEMEMVRHMIEDVVHQRFVEFEQKLKLDRWISQNTSINHTEILID